jgi:hypothetical protein
MFLCKRWECGPSMLLTSELSFEITICRMSVPGNETACRFLEDEGIDTEFRHAEWWLWMPWVLA